MQATESAVIVPVPEAEQVVSGHRARLDPAAAWGVPAHVTVLYPFVHPEQIDDDVLSALGEAIGSVTATQAAFHRVDWFSETVVWMDPEPATVFGDLTRAVWSRFPACPPYAGAHADVVPHLTIGEGAPTAELHAAAESVQAYLPIRTTVDVAHLICGTRAPHAWHTVAELPLGPQGGD